MEQELLAHNFHFKKLMFWVHSLCQSKFVSGFTLMKGYMYCSKCQVLDSPMVEQELLAHNFHFKKLMFWVHSLCQSKFVSGFTLMKGYMYCSKCQLLDSPMVANLSVSAALLREVSYFFSRKKKEVYSFNNVTNKKYIMKSQWKRNYDVFSNSKKITGFMVSIS